MNLWQPQLGSTQLPSYALAPFARRIVYDALSNLLAAGRKPRIKPLSTAYGAAALGAMQGVFGSLAAQNPGTISVLDVSQVSGSIFSGGVLGGGDGSVHYNLDTHLWFVGQAIGSCLVQGQCGVRITSVPATPPN